MSLLFMTISGIWKKVDEKDFFFLLHGGKLILRESKIWCSVSIYGLLFLAGLLGSPIMLYTISRLV